MTKAAARTARRSRRRTGAEAVGARRGRTVRSSAVALAFMTYCWLLSPLGWPVLVTVGGAIAAGRGVDNYSWGFVATMAAISAPSCWLAWRFMGRRAVPLDSGSGIRVCSFLRSFDVAWNDVKSAEATEMSGNGRWFAWSHTVVVFRADRERRVVVSMTCRSGSAGRFRICTWAPAHHPIRHFLPAGWRDSTSVPAADAAERAEVRAAPPIETIAMDPVMRWVYMGFCLALTAACGFGAVRLARFDAAIPNLLSWSLVGAALLLLVAAWRAGRARIVVTRAGLRIHNILHNLTVGRSEIAGFADSATSMLAVTARVELAGRGSRALTAGTGYGSRTADVLDRLSRWLAEKPAPHAST